MQQSLKELLDDISNYHDSENIDFDLFDKVKGELYEGAKAKVFWRDREQEDDGYIFCLPHQNADEFDACIHVPHMDNSDGIGEGEPIWKHLYSVVELDRVLKIEVL